MSRARRFKFSTIAFLVQTAFVLIFAFLAEYDSTADPKVQQTADEKFHQAKMYAPFQDVHVMIFVGFGFLMTFLKRYGYSAIGFNLMIGAFVIQWALIVRGCIYQDVFKGEKFKLIIDEMVTADFACGTVLISFGAVLGKTSHLQLVIMLLLETVIAQVNGWICHDKLHAVDVGESMYIHAFGAYFGLAVSATLKHRKIEIEKSESVYHSDLFSMIGTLFLWMFWPSFNGGGASEDEQHRAFINTYLSLCACTVVTFIFTALYDKNGKFTMEYIQNATLAGGVAVGTTANMPLQPYGALLSGCAAGFICVTGYRFLTEFMARRLRIHDTCGVHNLHGMPAVIAGCAGSIMAAMSSQKKWGRSLYEIFPYMAPKENTTEYLDLMANPNFVGIEPGKGWSSSKQAAHQIAALGITLGMAIVGGLVTGLIIKLPILDQVEHSDDLFDDNVFWNVAEEIPGSEEGHEDNKMHGHQMATYTNKAVEETNGIHM